MAVYTSDASMPVNTSPAFTELTTTAWDLTVEGNKKTDTLTANTAITLTNKPAFFDGALFLVTNNNFTLSIGGTDITSKIYPTGETMIGIVWVDNLSQYRFYTDYSSSGTNTGGTVSAPSVSGNDTENKLFATHADGPSVIYVSANGGAYTAWTTAATLDTVNNVYYIAVGDFARAAGYWKFKATVNGVDSTIVDSPAFTSGVSVAAVYSFGNPGTDQNIDIANGIDYRMALTQPFTVAVWLKEMATGAQFSMAVSDASQRNWGFDVLGNTCGLNIFADGGATYTGASSDDTTTPAATEWKRYLVTCDGTGTAAGIKTYINGIDRTLNRNANASIATMNQVGVLKIGYFPGFQAKDVYINNVLIEKYAYSLAEVTADYENGNINRSMSVGVDGDGWSFDSNSLASLKGTHNGTATTPQFIAV